jgi:hypothetical protein
MNAARLVLLLSLAALLPGCASLGSLAQALQAPRFEIAPGQQAQLTLLAPSAQRPLGGASIRLWAQVTNPNPLGLTLSRLAGGLALEGIDAASVDFPLGLPLPASGSTVVPLDIAISFSDVPRLAQLIPRAVTGGAVAYRLNGTATLDAGVLGQPSFGPMTLLQGSIQTRR